MRSLDKLSAPEASRSVEGGATIAAHAQHLRFGLSLMNRWAAEGGDPFSDAKWDEAWKTSRVDDDEWAAIRQGLRDEVQRWLRALGSPRQVTPLELNGMVGSIAHLAYHLGAIRQIAAAARGPRDQPLEAERRRSRSRCAAATRRLCWPRLKAPHDIPNSRRPRVLVADDHPEMVKAICRLLALDCEVVGTVRDGADVLGAAQRLRPDVVVIDLNLPTISGLEACRQITRVHPETKVIVFTAANDPHLRQRAIELGASAFVCKVSSDDDLALGGQGPVGRSDP